MSNYLTQGHWKFFGKQWPPWLGGLLLGLVKAGMFFDFAIAIVTIFLAILNLPVLSIAMADLILDGEERANDYR